MSPVDPDVKWGAKSDKKTWAGMKAHIAMTSNRTVTSVVVTSANITDDKVACELFDQQEYKPSTMTGDGAYGTGENRVEYKKRECALIAPLRGQENPHKALFQVHVFVGWEKGHLPWREDHREVH